MSGQWDSGVEKPTEGTSCFPRLRPGQILEEILNQDKLIEKIYQLTADETKITESFIQALEEEFLVCGF